MHQLKFSAHEITLSNSKKAPGFRHWRLLETVALYASPEDFIRGTCRARTVALSL